MNKIDARPYLAEVVLELFDAATGRKVDESRGENYITPAGIAHNRWMVRADYMSNMPGVGNLDVEPPNPFREVYLSDSAAAPDTASDWPEGVITAWANKTTYSGGDTFRGSPNSSECEADTARAKWVFDWPTTAGNGPIRSVGMRMTSGGQYTSIPAVFSGWGASPVAVYGAVFDPSGGLWVAPVSPTHPIMLLDISGPSIGTLITGPTCAEVGFNAIGGLAIDGTHMYACQRAGVSGYGPGVAPITKFPIPTDSTDPAQTSITVSGAPNLCGVTYDGTMLWVIDGSTQRALRVDKSTGAIDRQFSLVGTRANWITYHPVRNTLLVGQWESSVVDEYDTNGVRVGTWSHPYSGTFNRPQPAIEPGGTYVVGNGGSTLLRCRPLVGSRVLLPSLVTKTSLQTMKLTYTFTYT